VVKLGQSLYREAPGMDVYRPKQKTPVQNFFLAGSYTYQVSVFFCVFSCVFFCAGGRRQAAMRPGDRVGRGTPDRAGRVPEEGVVLVSARQGVGGVFARLSKRSRTRLPPSHQSHSAKLILDAPGSVRITSTPWRAPPRVASSVPTSSSGAPPVPFHCPTLCPVPRVPPTNDVSTPCWALGRDAKEIKERAAKTRALEAK
jgi:hypothetical protein